MKRASRVLYPGRPAVVWRVYFGPWEGEGSRASRPSLKTTYSGISTGEVVPGRRRSLYTAISEPETALLLTVGKQGAGAAQRRPRCRASSETSTPDSHSVAAGQGTSNEKPTPWTVPGKRQTSRRLTAWPPATWSRGAGWRPTHAGGDRRPRSPARPCRPFPSLPARPPHRAPVHPARLASRRQASRPCHGHQQAASGPGLPAAPRAGHVVRVDGHARRDRVLNNSATSGRGSARRRRRATGDCSRRESRSVRLRDHWAARARPIVAHHERQAEQTRKPTLGTHLAPGGGSHGTRPRRRSAAQRQGPRRTRPRRSRQSAGRLAGRRRHLHAPRHVVWQVIWSAGGPRSTRAGMSGFDRARPCASIRSG